MIKYVTLLSVVREYTVRVHYTRVCTCNLHSINMTYKRLYRFLIVLCAIRVISLKNKKKLHKCRQQNRHNEWWMKKLSCIFTRNVDLFDVKSMDEKKKKRMNTIQLMTSTNRNLRILFYYLISLALVAYTYTI